MTNESLAHERGVSIVPSLGQVVTTWLPVAGALGSCWLSFSSDMAVPIERPWLLGLGALAATLPFRLPAVETLQRVVVFYLMSIPLSELSTRYLAVSIFPARPVSVCNSALVLCLWGIGYGVDRLAAQEADPARKRPVLVLPYVLAMMVIVAHMLGLWGLLARFYGYGFERDLNILGQVSLYFLLLLFSWRVLGLARARQVLAVGLGLGYLLSATAGG